MSIVREKYSDRLPVEELPVLEKLEDVAKFGVYPRGEGFEFRKYSKFYKVIKEIRNRDFSGSIADSLCQYSGSSTHLVVLVGEGHASGISRILQGLSGGRVKIHHYRTWDKADLDALAERLLKVEYKKR